MSGTDYNQGGRGRGNSMGSSFNASLRRPSLDPSTRTESSSSLKSNSSNPSNNEEKPLASGNGVSISIMLAEPALYLQGYDQADMGSRATTMLRGTFHLKVLKSAKIKSITLNFRGLAQTEWPEGDSSTSLVNYCFSTDQCRHTT